MKKILIMILCLTFLLGSLSFAAVSSASNITQLANNSGYPVKIQLIINPNYCKKPNKFPLVLDGQLITQSTMTFVIPNQQSINIVNGWEPSYQPVLKMIKLNIYLQNNNKFSKTPIIETMEAATINIANKPASVLYFANSKNTNLMIQTTSFYNGLMVIK